MWLGPSGPPALAVTGRLADGWIPSLAYMPTGEIPAMRRRIDAAAEAAGRRPGEICGILNVSIRTDPDVRPGTLQVGAVGGAGVVDQLAEPVRLAGEVLVEMVFG